MNRLRVIVRAVLGFSRAETNAFIILLPLLLVIIFSQPLYRWIVQSPILLQDTVKLNSVLATWKWKDSTLVNKKTKRADVASQRSLFMFDPNRATDEQLLSLGFTKFQMNRLMNYRTKGGKFFIKSDLLKLYGMDSSLYRRLYTFIDLPKTKDVSQKQATTQRASVADINLADTTQLKGVYGIGSKLAKRIISYREKLGGFVSLHQLNEVYGLDSVVIKKLIQKFQVVEGFAPRQIKINSADEMELAKHPYFKRNVAKAVVAYRYQHGHFVQFNDLLHIQLMTSSDLIRVKPYLTLNP